MNSNSSERSEMAKKYTFVDGFDITKELFVISDKETFSLIQFRIFHKDGLKLSV